MDHSPPLPDTATTLADVVMPPSSASPSRWLPRSPWPRVAGTALVLGGLGAVLFGSSVADGIRAARTAAIASWPVSSAVPATLTASGTVAEEQNVINIVAQANPAVVSIGTQVRSFSRFGGSTSANQGIGTGFVVRSDGYIVTNKHVVADEDATYYVLDSTGATHAVTDISRSPSDDLALLKINATGLTALPIGDSDALRVGQFAIAIGNALGDLQNTVTTGVVSGLDRSITAGTGSGYRQGSESLAGVIQTDAAINGGNSGGPLLDSGGRVIGINTAASVSGQNIGFALPSNLIASFIRTNI